MRWTHFCRTVTVKPEAATGVTRPVERLTAETVTAEPLTSAVTAVSSRSVASTLNWVAVPSPIKVLMRRASRDLPPRSWCRRRSAPQRWSWSAHRLCRMRKRLPRPCFCRFAHRTIGFAVHQVKYTLHRKLTGENASFMSLHSSIWYRPAPENTAFAPA